MFIAQKLFVVVRNLRKHMKNRKMRGLTIIGMVLEIILKLHMKLQRKELQGIGSCYGGNFFLQYPPCYHYICVISMETCKKNHQKIH